MCAEVHLMENVSGTKLLSLLLLYKAPTFKAMGVFKVINKHSIYLFQWDPNSFSKIIIITSEFSAQSVLLLDKNKTSDNIGAQSITREKYILQYNFFTSEWCVPWTGIQNLTYDELRKNTNFIHFLEFIFLKT